MTGDDSKQCYIKPANFSILVCILNELNLRYKTTKLQEDKIQENLNYLMYGDNFLNTIAGA